MKTASKFFALAYEAPQAELLQICVEQNLLASQEDTAGQDITLLDEEGFDDFFNNN